MKAWFIQHQHALLNTWQRMWRQPAGNLLNIVVVGIAFALPLLGFTLLHSLKPLTNSLSSEPEISVFMQLGASRAESAQIEQTLQAVAEAAEVTFVSREAALNELKTQDSMKEVLATLPSNPLPDAFIVKLKIPAGTQYSARLEKLAQDFRALPKVQHVQIDSAWVKRLEAMLRFLQISLIVLGVALGSAIIAIVFNTIRLQVLTQRDEIEIAKLIGATNAYIRRPFYYTGALQGLLGGLVALLLVLGLLFPLNQSLSQFAQLYLPSFQLHPLPLHYSLGWLSLATLLGLFGALLSVSRYLHKTP